MLYVFTAFLSSILGKAQHIKEPFSCVYTIHTRWRAPYLTNYVNGHEFGFDALPRIRFSSWLWAFWVLLSSQGFSVRQVRYQAGTHSPWHNLSFPIHVSFLGSPILPNFIILFLSVMQLFFHSNDHLIPFPHSPLLVSPLPPPLCSIATFSWRGLLCSVDCTQSYVHILLSLCAAVWTQPAKCLVEKEITPQWVISGWVSRISQGTLIMESTWIMNGVYNTVLQARWMN